MYLWGVLVTQAGASTYTHFSDKAVDDEAAELAVARRCFDWLAANHPNALVYHYAHVEKSHATRILGSKISSYLGTDSPRQQSSYPESSAQAAARTVDRARVTTTNGHPWY